MQPSRTNRTSGTSRNTRTTLTIGLSVLQVAALAGTYYLDGLGAAWWHHVASLAVVLALAAAFWPAMQSRRFLGIGVLVSTILATISGFYLLYWKEGIRVDGYQDWGVFWHVAWSWAAAVFFWQHTWVNRVAFAHYFKRSLRALAPAAFHIGLYVAAIAGFVVTAGPGKDWFTVETYIPLSYWTWLACIVVAYGAWWFVRGRTHAAKKRVRGGVDLALVPTSALAVLSGIPLLFLGAAMDALGLKYASKFWHVAPSVLFAVLVFVHSVQLWRTMRAHWRRMGRGEGKRPVQSR